MVELIAQAAPGIVLRLHGAVADARIVVAVEAAVVVAVRRLAERHGDHHAVGGVRVRRGIGVLRLVQRGQQLDACQPQQAGDEREDPATHETIMC